ncbi:MAG TPA: transposase [Alphaproteobacteria bacterium]|nr:transposase [Alphaproteobacteria bacterium]
MQLPIRLKISYGVGVRSGDVGTAKSFRLKFPSWGKDRRIPADNHLAERHLRPTVMARKVSFGSQSDAGARTRGTLMSILHTLKKRQADAVVHLKRVLDHLAQDIHQDPWPLLFPEGPT